MNGTTPDPRPTKLPRQHLFSNVFRVYCGRNHTRPKADKTSPPASILQCTRSVLWTEPHQTQGRQNFPASIYSPMYSECIMGGATPDPRPTKLPRQHLFSNVFGVYYGRSHTRPKADKTSPPASILQCIPSVLWEEPHQTQGRQNFPASIYSPIYSECIMDGATPDPRPTKLHRQHLLSNVFRVYYGRSHTRPKADKTSPPASIVQCIPSVLWTEPHQTQGRQNFPASIYSPMYSECIMGGATPDPRPTKLPRQHLFSNVFRVYYGRNHTRLKADKTSPPASIVQCIRTVFWEEPHQTQGRQNFPASIYSPMYSECIMDGATPYSRPTKLPRQHLFPNVFGVYYGRSHTRLKADKTSPPASILQCIPSVLWTEPHQTQGRQNFPASIYSPMYSECIMDGTTPDSRPTKLPRQHLFSNVFGVYCWRSHTRPKADKTSPPASILQCIRSVLWEEPHQTQGRQNFPASIYSPMYSECIMGGATPDSRHT